jgi:hypothetical protein
MSFADQEITPQQRAEIEFQRKLKQGIIKPVGFYVDQKRWNDMIKKAQELYNQTQPDGQGGTERLLDSPDPNHYVNFCVNFFEQNYGLMRQFMNAKDPKAVFKGLVKQLMGQMG